MPEVLGEGEKPILTPEDKIALVKSKPQLSEAIAELIEAIIPVEQTMIEQHIARQSWNLHFYGVVGDDLGPVNVGEKIEIIVLRNDKEVGHMTHVAKEAAGNGLEIRPFIQYFATEMAKFVQSEPIKP